MSTPRQVETPPAFLTEAQLVQIQSIVTRTVEQSVSEIASNAVQAAVQAMANVTPPSNASIPIARDEIESKILLSTSTQTLRQPTQLLI